MNRWIKFAFVLSFWKILSYVHLFLALFIRLNPWLKQKLPATVRSRIDFENKNLGDEKCVSFFTENKQAVCCFQISSEGEFEQVRWLAENLLSQSHLIEIIFTSPSVEHRILNLAGRFPQSLRYLRAPIATIHANDLSGWITAETIVLVRYDFYPMILSLANSKNLVLLWFFRPGDKKNLFSILKWKLILPLFSKVVASNQNDWWWLRTQLSFKELWQVPMDLRSLSIIDRLEKSETTLDKFFPGYKNNLKTLIHSVPRSIIHGNAYMSELLYLNDQNWKSAIEKKDILLALVAHHPQHLEVHKLAEYYDLKFYEFSTGMSVDEIQRLCTKWQADPGVIIFKGKGFLLELYSDFLISLVGGGFEGHTHSILEPFLANTYVYCGPRVFRSSEYYQAKELDSQKVICLATIYQWKTDALKRLLSEEFLNSVKAAPSFLSSKTLQNQVLALLKELDVGN